MSASETSMILNMDSKKKKKQKMKNWQDFKTNRK